MTTGVNTRAETWARTWLIWEPYFLLLFFTFQPEGEQHPSLGGNSLWNVLSFSALYKKLWTWNCRPSHPHCWINTTCKHKSSFMLSQARLSPPPWGDSSTSLCFVISGGWSWCRPSNVFFPFLQTKHLSEKWGGRWRTGRGDNCLQKVFRFHVFSWIPREAALGRQGLYPWLDWTRLKDPKISIAGMPSSQVLPDFSESSTD